MPRTYIRKTERGHYGSEALQKALCDLKEGLSLKAAAEKYGIDRKTLRRHRDGKVANPGKISLGRFRPELNEEYELALTAKIKSMEALLFGLTVRNIRKLAFDLAEKLGVPHRFNKETGLAGPDWLSGFLKRNPSISIRTPEAVSISRAIGFNKSQIDQFFFMLQANLGIRPIFRL